MRRERIYLFLVTVAQIMLFPSFFLFLHDLIALLHFLCPSISVYLDFSHCRIQSYCLSVYGFIMSTRNATYRYLFCLCPAFRVCISCFEHVKRTEKKAIKRIYIETVISILSSFTAAPQNGHIDLSKHICGYLSKMRNDMVGAHWSHCGNIPENLYIGAVSVESCLR